jgi:curved DNA-binding protein CbpA
MTNDFYAVLGVPRTATEKEIKDAYRKLVRTHHPDKGGDPAKFKELTEAHTVLSDSKLRDLYDRGQYTGSTKSIDDIARAKLASLFSQIVESIHEINVSSKDIIKDLKKAVSTTIESVRVEIVTLEVRVKTLSELNSRLSGKDTMLNDIVEHKIAETKRVAEEAREMIKVLELIIVNCEGYKYDTEKPKSANWDTSGFEGYLLQMLNNKDL